MSEQEHALSPGAKIAIAIGSYTAVGLVVAFWTIKRNSRGDASFSGLSPGEKPARILAECVFLWPLAVYKNLAPGEAEKIATARGGTITATPQQGAQEIVDKANARVALAAGS